MCKDSISLFYLWLHLAVTKWEVQNELQYVLEFVDSRKEKCPHFVAAY